jgi:hypothetical protein
MKEQQSRFGVATRNEQEPEVSVRNRENRTLRFQEPDYMVSSGPTTIRDVVGLRQGASPSIKRRLDGGEA